MPVEGEYVMAGGGTGGHVIPALAVARELRRRGHAVVFFGTRQGLEARLAPAEGFPVEWIEIGGLMNVGLVRRLRTLWQLMAGTRRVHKWMRARRPAAVFSMGGYAAGPPVIAAILAGVPVVAMEPNAVPGLTNRAVRGKIARALTNFDETARYFPAGKVERTGVPVRQEFFRLPPRPPGEAFHVLVTGGSQGARTLNRAARESWPLFRAGGARVHMTLQCGRNDSEDELNSELARQGMAGRVTAFLDDMPAAFAAADLIVCRAGAGAVAELAAAGKPGVLVPFPHAAGQHQLRNAEAMERAGAARLVRDGEMNGRRLVEIVGELAAGAETLRAMGEAARKMARAGAAVRAAEILEEEARRRAC